MLAAHTDPAEVMELRARLEGARTNTDRLFDIVRSDSLYERPIAERHRIVFYIGHLEAFDFNLLREQLPGLEPFHPEFDRLFAFGIDPVGGDLPSDVPSDWPSLAEVRGYKEQTRQAVDAALAAQEFPSSLLLNVAVEHRLMHAETLAYMLHQMPVQTKLRQTPTPAVSAGPWEPEMVRVPAGKVTLGRSSADGDEFGWDNEFEAAAVAVPEFEVDKYMVTNGEYLKFMAAGKSVSPPLGWRLTKDGWIYRTMFNEIPLPLDWPVYVSHAQASAYARWSGKVLPTEAQWQRAAYGADNDWERPYPWGSEPPGPRHGNFDFERWDPAPVNAFSAGRSFFGVHGLLGNGWEWTSSLFEPLPGFRPFSFYPGYSANFFDGKHYVIKGGSARTAACMLRRSFRNWFQPDYPYIYAGFRTCR